MSPARTIRALLIEDSPLLRTQVTELLHELAPVRIVGTAEGEESAVGWLSDPTNECELVIVDIFLKSGSGLRVLRDGAMLRPDARFVVLTNYATPDMRRWCVQLGATAVFDKSTEIDELVEYCGRLGQKPGPAASVVAVEEAHRGALQTAKRRLALSGL